MSQYIELIFFLLLNLMVVNGRPGNKFVYEKEISEHCLRRVMPSVFLGRHVVDAYAQVLYFSKADLPYGCYVSVRAESGSNIILVVQLLSAEDLIASCANDGNQLLVYEMGETFGGYWGPMPHSFIQQERNLTTKPTRADTYTIKYSQPTVSKTSTQEKSSDIKTLSYSKESTESPVFVEEKNFITLVVPLVNISGRFEPGEEDKESAFEEENFDLVYDVLPRQNERYSTTMMPLVQFSAREEPAGGRRWGYEDLMSRYSLAHNLNTFTPDYRLKHQKFNESVNRRLKFKDNKGRRPLLHNKTLFSSIRDDLINPALAHHKKPSNFITINEIKTTEKNINSGTETWRSIEELISAYNESGLLTTFSDDVLNHEISELINKLNIDDDNESVYLNISHSTNNSDLITKGVHAFTKIPKLTKSDKGKTFGFHLNYNNNEENATHLEKSTTVVTIFEKFQENLSSNNTNTTTSANSTPTSNTVVNKIKEDLNLTDTKFTEGQSIMEPAVKERTAPMAGTLLDHESWENLLRVAPLMAGRLEETVPQKIMEELEKTSDTEVTQSGNQANTTKIPLEQKMNSMVRRKRKKRFIQGIMIDDAKPHRLATKEEVSTTTSSSVQISDIQQFAQLVELIDDDIHDRAALRYLSQYVGQPMFNLCNYDQPKPRYVHLFKSSRLVVAIGNFTLRRMQLVMTPARMLYTGRSRCEQSHLECQVAGNRVCIDSMSACDGVANCGTPDIYDEDRLMCGAYVGLRHNVCLAAITFIAVLLTFIYMVHYWLGRCVPKVSEAFFIYTEGDENILYLDTVMRSPHDIGTGVVGAKSLDAFEIDALFTVETPKTSKFRSLLHNLLPCCFKKVDKNKSVSVDWDQLHSSPTNTMFSFPELEIRRMANMDHKDICVQTGESLEMQNMPLTIKATSKDPAERQRSVNLTSPVSNDEQKRINDELNIMKILNKRRIDSMAARTSYKLGDYEELTELSPNLEQGPEEMEIQNQFYDPRWQEQSRRYQRRSAHSEILKDDAIPKISKLVTSKRLRFSEDVVNIPRTRGYSDDEVSISQNDDNTKPQDNVNESGPSTSKDFKRFWGGSKGRKSKKKT